MAQIRRIFSGIQPSGIAHLGNYLGAIQRWVQLQDQCSSVLYSIVDLHSLTVPQAPLLLRENIRGMVVCLLACGVDPQKSTLFQQSQIPHHTELAWLLSCRTPTGWLNRMTQWKVMSESVACALEFLDNDGTQQTAFHPDGGQIFWLPKCEEPKHGCAEEKGEYRPNDEYLKSKGATDNRDLVSLGLFAYPVLMSADILLYKATHVPVGDDQLQHLELARDIAKSFNSHYGSTFPDPQPLLGKVRRIMSLRNPLQKMSKSDNQELSRINLSDPPDRIRNTVRKAITDSDGEVSYDPTKRPAVSNLVSIYAAVTGLSHEDVCTKYQGKQTVDFKDELADVLIEKIFPIQKEMMYLEQNPDYVDKVLSEGAEKAKELANTNLNQVKQLLGLQ